MKIQISFLELKKKKIRSENSDLFCVFQKKSLIADFEIQKKNHNNKSTRTFKENF